MLALKLKVTIFNLMCEILHTISCLLDKSKHFISIDFCKTVDNLFASQLTWATLYLMVKAPKCRSCAR